VRADWHRRAAAATVIETASDAIIIAAAARRVAFANPAASGLFGLPADRLLGASVADLTAPEERDEVARREDVAFAGTPQRYETVVVRSDGERRIVSVSTAPMRQGGRVTGIVASLRDFTDERERRDALRLLEVRYRHLFESASDALFTVDEGGRFTSVNRALVRSLGRTRGALLGSPALDAVEPEDREAMGRLFAATLRGTRQRGELRFRDRWGAVRTGSITTTPIGEGGAVRGALGIVRDVTEERRLAEQLLQREKLAAVGQLVSGVAHELNNPLAAITALSELLLSTPPSAPPADAEQRDMLATIHAEARRASKIISSLLLFARQRRPERRPTDLNRVLLDVLALRQHALSAAQVEVATDLDADLPATWADASQLQQVFLNLLANAEQALRAHAGRKELRVRTRRDGDRLVASVSDTGPGVPAAVLDRIFEPFYTTKPMGEGTGLELSISDGIVREHGGQIRVDSRPGAGATFSVELPLAATPPEARVLRRSTPPKMRAMRAPPAADASHPRPARACTFLIVDDEPAIRAALTLPWSTGPVEGHVTRLKLLKRQMYGRAKLDLLRLRLLAR
jgi:PAS domain S-box-containing protein